MSQVCPEQNALSTVNTSTFGLQDDVPDTPPGLRVVRPCQPALMIKRACLSLSAGVSPSFVLDFGPFTPLTGLCITALRPQRYSNNDETAESLCRIVAPSHPLLSRSLRQAIEIMASKRIFEWIEVRHACPCNVCHIACDQCQTMHLRGCCQKTVDSRVGSDGIHPSPCLGHLTGDR